MDLASLFGTKTSTDLPDSKSLRLSDAVILMEAGKTDTASMNQNQTKIAGYIEDMGRVTLKEVSENNDWRASTVLKEATVMLTKGWIKKL